MAPQPVQKDLFYFTTLCSTYSLRRIPFVKTTTLRMLSSSDKMEDALDLITKYGSGHSHQEVMDHRFVSTLEGIVQQFESKKAKLSEIMKCAANELSDILSGGSPETKKVFTRFQAMLQDATREQRMETARKKIDAKKELVAAFEHAIKSDIDDDEKLREILALHEEFMSSHGSTYVPQDD